VTFFGDVVNRTTVHFVYNKLAESDAVLVAGSSLQASNVSSISKTFMMHLEQGYSFLLTKVKAPGL